MTLQQFLRHVGSPDPRCRMTTQLACPLSGGTEGAIEVLTSLTRVRVGVASRSRRTFARVGDRLAFRKVGPTAKSVRRNNLTYLNWTKLWSIERACDEVRTLPGNVIECGVALGGSGILLATLLEDREFHGYDVFGRIPAPSTNDPPEAHERYSVIASGESAGLGGETYYGYVDDLFNKVMGSFSDFGVAVGGRVQLHRGLLEATLNPQSAISLAHIDCDWYESVALCLRRIAPHLVPGALIIIDDYFDYGGARRATDEHVASTTELAVFRDAGHRVLRYEPLRR